MLGGGGGSRVRGEGERGKGTSVGGGEVVCEEVVEGAG